MAIYGDDVEYVDDAPLNAVGGGGGGWQGSRYFPIFQLLAQQRNGGTVSGVCGVCFVTQNKENAARLLFELKNA
jgi:hypothetical protein